jgi:hypothetical protein
MSSTKGSHVTRKRGLNDSAYLLLSKQVRSIIQACADARRRGRNMTYWVRALQNCIIAAALIAISGPALGQDNVQAGRDASLKKALRAWDKDDDDRSVRYIVGFYDLNGDGKDEAIAQLLNSSWCGTGGCTTLVLVRRGDSWRVISDISVVQLPIRVLARTSHGWHSLGVWVQGGGIQPGYEAEIPFDGRKYANNPTLPPAVAIRATEGEIILPNDLRMAKPLYESAGQ